MRHQKFEIQDSVNENRSYMNAGKQTVITWYKNDIILTKKSFNGALIENKCVRQVHIYDFLCHEKKSRMNMSQ